MGAMSGFMVGHLLFLLAISLNMAAFGVRSVGLMGLAFWPYMMTWAATVIVCAIVGEVLYQKLAK